MQTCAVSWQTRPELGPPQSLSVSQPHVSFGKQTAPGPLGVQLFAPASPGTHSTHVFVFGSQTSPPVQSGVSLHWTHTPPEIPQTGVGALHWPVPPSHALPVQSPVPPSCTEQ